jgi:hypothetical protein
VVETLRHQELLSADGGPAVSTIPRDG